MSDPQSPGLAVATDHAELINNYRYSVIVQPGAVVKEGESLRSLAHPDLSWNDSRGEESGQRQRAH